MQRESEWIRECFKNMLREQHRHSHESQEALLLHLEIFLLYVKRIGEESNAYGPNCSGTTGLQKKLTYMEKAPMEMHVSRADAVKQCDIANCFLYIEI
ncbi:hypothetical protein ACLI09_15800 [Flavobacterium sp. RHBU_24]|uniref:hypothetical protein n=1 Tax=Flavobacterium sp. RHBU_24 TaxID=3391185 RepID=UPI003984AD02